MSDEIHPVWIAKYGGKRKEISATSCAEDKIKKLVYYTIYTAHHPL